MRITLASAVLAMCLAAGCGGGTEIFGLGRTVKVVATTTQLTDFTRVVAGARAEVYDVIRSNVDAHDYEPSPADLQAIHDADVVVKNGVGLEQWFEPTIASADPRGRVVDAGKGTRKLPGEGDEAGARDPHIWLDPRNAEVMVANIAGALAAVDPAGTLTYRANARAYDAQLRALDAEIARQIGGLTNKKLVSNHDAFAYYVHRYGLEFVGSVIPSFDTQAELSGTDIAGLGRKIRAEGVKAVFSEVSLPAKTARAIASEARVKVVAGADALYSDSLGPRGSDGDTYLKMQRHNTRVIVENLR
jgi:ABC-type Zn uptake system ZnuABC Zn-binding protein ZnuA